METSIGKTDVDIMLRNGDLVEVKSSSSLSEINKDLFTKKKQLEKYLRYLKETGREENKVIIYVKFSETDSDFIWLKNAIDDWKKSAGYGNRVVELRTIPEI